MEANSSPEISANSFNRYARAEMNHQLEAYRQFKNQYQVPRPSSRNASIINVSEPSRKYTNTGFAGRIVSVTLW